MKYIKPSFLEISESDPFKKIALVAHNCYQVNKDTDQDAFVMRLLGFKHYAMIEHYVFAASVPLQTYQSLKELACRFIVLAADGKGNYYAAFSLRPLLEADKEEYQTLSLLSGLLDAKYQALLPFKGEKKAEGKLLSEEEVNQLPYPVYKKIKTVTLQIITDRGVTHELVRHRIASYAQESTRYCNYSKDKFGNELTFIAPLDYQEHAELYDRAFKEAEENYFALLNAHSTPEMARAVLPNKLKASIIITASVEEYERIFELRTSERAHPDMREVMLPIQLYFYNKGYLKHE
jgi:hypothetical protein